MIKTVYLAKRNPDTTPAEFYQNWRQHAALAASFPSIVNSYLGIIQCRPVAGGDLPGLDVGYDGANVLTLKSLLASLEVYNDPNIDTMLADERRVFSDYVLKSSLTAHESALVDRPIGPMVLLEFVRRTPGTDPGDFIRSWTGAFARHLMATPTFPRAVGRYVHNHVVLPPPEGYEYDGISEAWVEDQSAARALLAQSEASRAALGDVGFRVGLRLLLEVSHSWFAPT